MWRSLMSCKSGGQLGAKFVQLSIQLVLIDHVLCCLFWSQGMRYWMKQKKQKPTNQSKNKTKQKTQNSTLVKRNPSGKTKTKTTNQTLHLTWGFCDVDGQYEVKDLKFWGQGGAEPSAVVARNFLSLNLVYRESTSERWNNSEGSMADVRRI